MIWAMRSAILADPALKSPFSGGTPRTLISVNMLAVDLQKFWRGEDVLKKVENPFRFAAGCQDRSDFRPIRLFTNFHLVDFTLHHCRYHSILRT
jgi:hypothetical protein